MTQNTNREAANQRALDMIPDLANFMRDRGVLPTAGDHSRLYNALRRLRGMDIPDDLVAVLDAAYSGWRGRDRDSAWDKSLRQMADFVRDNGRLPTRTTHPELSAWLDEQIRYGRAAIPYGRQVALDAVAPGWDARS